MTEMPTNEEKNFATIAHVGGIFLGFIPSLIIWLIKKDESQFIADQAKEALNFQITISIATIIASALMFLLIGCLILPIIYLWDIVLCIIAAIEASKGNSYRYPFTLRLIN